MVEEAKYAAEQNDKVARLVVTNSEGSGEGQISDIEDLIAQGVDAIIVSAASPNALVPVVNRAEQQGIPVVDFDNLTASDQVTHVVVDQISFGEILGDWLMEQMGGSGDIAVFNGIEGTSISADRFQGLENSMEDNPDVEIVQTVYAAWAYNQARTAMEDIYSAHPNLDGIWSQGGAMSEAALDFYMERGIEPPPIPGEGLNGFMKTWKEVREEYPDWTSIATSMPTYVSARALEVAVRRLEGEDVPQTVNLDLPVITQDNFQDFLYPDLPDSYWVHSDLPPERVKKLYSR
jgi:ribose transport system substrate-binding protein